MGQACRGDRPDQGVEEEEKNEAHGQAKKRRAEALDGIAGDIGDVCRARPTWEDMIIAYSTIPGYASLRDHQHGTWFVQSLVEVFMTHSHDTELVDLLRMTSERLSHLVHLVAAKLGDHLEKCCQVQVPMDSHIKLKPLQ